MGKTQLFQRFAAQPFSYTYINTISVEVVSVTQRTEDMQIGPIDIKLSVWDTPGAERFRSVVAHYYWGADGLAFVYSVTDKTSFEKITARMRDAREFLAEKAVVIVGSKVDLWRERVVSYCEGAQLAEKVGVPFLEASARDFTTVKQVFQTMLALIEQKGRSPRAENYEI